MGRVLHGLSLAFAKLQQDNARGRSIARGSYGGARICAKPGRFRVGKNRRCRQPACSRDEGGNVPGLGQRLPVRAINAFLDRLPPVIEDAITNARTESGALNTPQGLGWLATLAIGSGTAAVPAQQKANLGDFEKMLRLDRRAYFKDDAVQLAYRRALGGPEAPEPALRPSAAIELEIKQLEQRMKSDRRGWFKDERARARYRTLLAQRDANS